MEGYQRSYSLLNWPPTLIKQNYLFWHFFVIIIITTIHIKITSFCAFRFTNSRSMYMVVQKWGHRLTTIILSNVNRFTKFFTGRILAATPCNLSLMACFADTNVSQGNAATYARCDGTFNIHFTAHLPGNLRVKKIRKSAKIWQNDGDESVAPFFSGAPCTRVRHHNLSSQPLHS